jgi:predicted transcriptional regulator
MTKDLHRELQSIAESRGESMALIAREALQSYLTRQGAVTEDRAIYTFPKPARKPKALP